MPVWKAWTARQSMSTGDTRGLADRGYFWVIVAVVYVVRSPVEIPILGPVVKTQGRLDILQTQKNMEKKQCHVM